MAIEFRCTQCNKLLRTGEGTAGKQAKCPECGAIVTIPAAGAGQPPPPTPPPEQPADAAGPMGAGGPQPADKPGSPFAPGGPIPPAFDPENPYAAPSQYAAAMPTYAPSGPITGTLVDFGDVFSRTWAIFKREWGMLLVVLIIVGAINFAVNMVVSFASGLIGAAAGEPAIAVMFSVLGNVVTWLFGIWIGIGQALYFLKAARGQRAELSDIFAGGPYFPSILGATILFALIYLGGIVLCVVPGVIFALMFSQYYYLILDRNVRIMESLSISKEITTGNKLTLFGISVVAALILVGGLCACCVGVLAAAPFVTLLAPVTYLVMTGQRTADQMMPGGPAVR